MRIVAERVRAGRSYVTGPGGDVVALHGAARPSCTTTLAHIGRVPDSIRALGRVRTAADARRRASARELAKNSHNAYNIAVFVVNTRDCS